MNERISKTETRQFKVIFPNTLNDHDTLFGGTAMQWMDEVAYITAIRFSKKKIVTVSSEKVLFLLPISNTTLKRVEHSDYSYSTPTELERHFIRLPPILLGVINIKSLRDCKIL